jgi:DNA repair exonuclease SbcCD ATPase subunit
LDLEFFEQKFKLAKEDSVDLKGALKRMESKNYDEELIKHSEDLQSARESLSKQQETCAVLKDTLSTLNEECSKTQKVVDSIPAEIIDIAAITTEIRNKENEITALDIKISEDEGTLKTKQGVYQKVAAFLDEFELSKYEDLQQQINEHQSQLKTEEETLDKLLEAHNNILKKEKLLQEHEYDPDCEYCSNNEFVKEAHNAVAQKSHVEIKQSDTLKEIEKISKLIQDLNPVDVANQLDRYSRMEDSKHTISSEIADLNLEIERNKNSIHTIDSSLIGLRSKRDEYEENKEAIENLETLLSQLNECHYRIKQTNKEIETCETSTLDFVKSVGSLEQKVENVKEQKKEYTDLQQEFAAYDLFMRCMHSNGIAYDIIKKKIPVINSEIAKVLANIVDFEVFFEASGNKFDIFIKHPRYDERPIEMASGAEKSLSAIAIRLALLGVSSLPTGDIFVLDEPGTALDEENMEGFIRILELIKVYFKNVLLISHLDSLKDCVDMQIVIEKKDGYAKVNQ